MSIEERQKISAKMSKARKGKKNSIESIEKTRIKNTGKKGLNYKNKK